jgi:hypothetical protein
MIKLIIQKKKTPGTAKSSVCLVRILDLFYWHPIMVLALGILGFVRKGAAPLVGQLGVEMAKEFVSFFLLFLVFGPFVTSSSSGVVSPGDWLVSSVCFLLSKGQVAIGAWGNSLPIHGRCSELLFSPGGSCIAL